MMNHDVLFVNEYILKAFGFQKAAIDLFKRNKLLGEDVTTFVSLVPYIYTLEDSKIMLESSPESPVFIEPNINPYRYNESLTLMSSMVSANKDGLPQKVLVDANSDKEGRIVNNVAHGGYFSQDYVSYDANHRVTRIDSELKDPLLLDELSKEESIYMYLYPVSNRSDARITKYVKDVVSEFITDDDFNIIKRQDRNRNTGEELYSVDCKIDNDTGIELLFENHELKKKTFNISPQMKRVIYYESKDLVVDKSIVCDSDQMIKKTIADFNGNKRRVIKKYLRNKNGEVYKLLAHHSSDLSPTAYGTSFYNVQINATPFELFIDRRRRRMF